MLRFYFSGSVQGMSDSWSPPKYTFWVMAIVALSVLTAGDFSIAATERSAAAILAEAVERDRALTRAEYLSALVSSRPIEPQLLVRAISGRHANIRRIAALQFGELDPAELNAQHINLLVEAVRDPDSGVAEQAITSLIRLGGKAPAMLLPLIRQTSPLRDFVYDSAGANSQRKLGITASDLAIAGLIYGSDVNLDALVQAYSDASRVEAGVADKRPEDRQSRSPLRGFSVEPGTSAYYANALRALLRRSPDAHSELINRLFDSEDLRLREIAYESAALVISQKARITARLTTIVQHSVLAEDRAAAAEALLAQGEAGRSSLIQLALSGNPSVRSAAFAPLVDGADCSSPLLARAMADSDISVRTKTLDSALGYRRGSKRYLPCLASMVLDPGIDLNLRKRVIYTALRPEDDADPASKPRTREVEDLFQILRPVLSDQNSDLYEPTWSLFHDLVRRHGISDTSIAEVARDRLRSGLTGHDREVVCTVSALAPTVLLNVPSLIDELINTLQTKKLDWSARECVDGALSRLDFRLPDLARSLEALLSALRSQEYLSDPEVALIEKSVPTDSFARVWNELALSKNGKPRLEIYRIAASRGLGTDQAITLFSDVLAMKTVGLDAKPTADAEYDLRYNFMPAAVRGLVAAGERGLEELNKVLRGESGSALGRSVTALELTRIDNQATLSLAPALLAAVSDKDPEVRRLVLYALPKFVNNEALLNAIRPRFDDADQNVLFEILHWIMDAPDLAPSPLVSLTANDAQSIVGSIAKHPYPFLREDAPRLMVKLRNRLSSAFVTLSLKELLLDADARPRAAAMQAVGDLGDSGASALEEALTDRQVSRLFDTLKLGVARVKSTERQKLQPRLLALFKEYPDSAPLLEAVGVLSDQDHAIALLMEEALLSDRTDFAKAALSALSDKYFFSSSSQRYLAALIDQRIGGYLDPYLGNVLEVIRPYFGPIPFSARLSTLPEFPWPPPTWSFKEAVPKALIGDDSTLLGEVSNRLAAAIRGVSSDFDYGLFGIPDGFLLLARLERINQDGSPYPGRLRWNANPIPPSSLDEYLIDLFLSPPGYFRVIAFAVAGDEPMTTQANAVLPSPSKGAKALPDELAKRSFAGYQLFALVYTFERYDGAKMVLNYEGSPSGLTHLVNSGIWGALKNTPAGK
ncbi:HEAT repeat domain-containing protein [Bradyrhizobium barranii]